MIITSVIKYLVFIVSTLLTYVLGLISKKHKWNDTLPIPIQNFLVGVAVFVLAYVFCLIMKYNLKPDELIQQILLSMGGSGLATLSYDTQKVSKGE